MIDFLKNLECNMKELDELNKAKNILSQVLGTGFKSLSGNKYAVQEAKHHIRQAVVKLEHATKKEMLRKKVATQSQTWWQDVQSGVQFGAKSGTQALNNINSLIDEQKRVLDELEKESKKISSDDGLINE